MECQKAYAALKLTQEVFLYKRENWFLQRKQNSCSILREIITLTKDLQLGLATTGSAGVRRLYEYNPEDVREEREWNADRRQ